MTQALWHVAHEQNTLSSELPEFPNELHGPISALSAHTASGDIPLTGGGHDLLVTLRSSGSEVATLSLSDRRPLRTTTQRKCATMSPGAQCVPRYTIVDRDGDTVVLESDMLQSWQTEVQLE